MVNFCEDMVLYGSYRLIERYLFLLNMFYIKVIIILILVDD